MRKSLDSTCIPSCLLISLIATTTTRSHAIRGAADNSGAGSDQPRSAAGTHPTPTLRNTARRYPCEAPSQPDNLLRGYESGARDPI